MSKNLNGALLIAFGVLAVTSLYEVVKIILAGGV